MGQVVSFINMKGGVGKTTLAVNVAYGLAYFHEKKVLIVDGDPQFNATQYLLEDDAYLAHIENPRKGTLLEVFSPKRAGPVNTVTGTARGANRSKMPLSACTCQVYAPQDEDGKLDLMPSTLRLMELEMTPRSTEKKLNNYLKEKASDYDYVIIDCPPTVTVFTQAAILASDKYLVPVKPDPLSVIGLPLLERWLEDFTETNGLTLEFVGLVFTLVRGNLPRRMREVMEELRQARGADVFEAQLSEAKHVADAVEAHQPVFRYDPRSNAAAQIRRITDEFLQRTTGD